jgi:hypothetical protein
MWTLAFDFDGLPIRVDGVIAVYESVNSVQIAPRGMSPEKASAYLVAYRTKEGWIRVISYLYYHENRHREVYLPDGLPLQSGVKEQLEDGLLFLESMGFMMNDLHCSDKSGQQMAVLSNELPFLWDSLEKYAEMHEQRLKGGCESAPLANPDFGRKATRTTGQVQTSVRPQAAAPARCEKGPEDEKLARLLASF